MATKTVNISLDEKLLKEIDKAAKSEYSSRSDYIRTSVVKSLKNQSVSNTEALKSANKILTKYKKDFKNLANRWNTWR